MDSTKYLKNKQVDNVFVFIDLQAKIVSHTCI